MRKYLEGGWIQNRFKGVDSSMFPLNSNIRYPYQHTYELKLARVIRPQPEPVYSQTMVVVEFVDGGKMINVGWPGPNVEVNKSGIVGGVSESVHGFYDGPVPGQAVLVGFNRGNSNSPMVIEKYSYPSDRHGDELDALHVLPITGKAHGVMDVLMSNFVGSYIAIRATTPIPGNIEVLSQAQFVVNATAGFLFNTPATFNLSATGAIQLTSKAAFDISATGALSISANANLSISGIAVSISGNAAMNISGSPVKITSSGTLTLDSSLVQIGSGSRKVAVDGDLTTTALGPKPITATGTNLLI